MTSTHPAPGKPHRFGEHAAVHAVEAIASAINLRDSRRSEPDRLGEKQWKP